MPKAFISYARDGSYGENLATEIQQQLQAAGFAVFRDVIGLKPGDVWYHKLEFELESSDVMVLVVSEKVRTSKWVHNEVSMAEEIGIPVIPVLAEKVRHPLWLRHLQVLDFCGAVDWRVLLEAVSLKIGGDAPEIQKVLLPEQHIKETRTHYGKSSIPSVVYPKCEEDFGSGQPMWANHAGNDKYGRYADLIVEGVTQRFRWIEPGTFWMGSPESENGRRDNEVRHQVTLTNGFWLADTACTQALWKAVMDENPAHFQDNPNNPVEQVSWNDVQEFFLHRLNRMVSGLKARLPTEAEWEYSCRAGTTGAFNFMGELSLSKVNYNGSWDREKIALFAKRTLQRSAPVKSYTPNHWGLYEMHGNVWEWCQDIWQEKLQDKPVKNPTYVSTDNRYGYTKRVVRGGAWVDSGREIRSASRSAYDSFHYFDSMSFRFVISH